MIRKLASGLAGMAGALFAASGEASTPRDAGGAAPTTARILALPPAPPTAEGRLTVAGNSSSNTSSNSSDGVHTYRRDHRWSDDRGRRYRYSEERHWRDDDDRRRYYYQSPAPSQHYHFHLPPLSGPPRRN